MCLRALKRIVLHVSIGLLTLFIIVYFAVSFRGADKDAIKKRISKGIREVRERLSECVGRAMKTVGQCRRRKVECKQFDEHRVRTIFEEELRKFSTDRTGMTDFAMKNLGGTIVSSSDPTFEPGQLAVFDNGRDRSDPSAVLEPNAFPGDCWAFPGTKAEVVIRLFARIHVHNVTLEHIPPYVSPTGDIKSAPRLFAVVGLAHPSDDQGHSYGSFVYRDDGPAVQTFPVKYPSDSSFQFVRIHFQENHGNEKFTCVYRVRIHGERANSIVLPPI